MVEQRQQTQVEEYNPEDIKKVDCGFYTKLLLPVRRTKPGRELIEFSPKFQAIREVCGEDLAISYKVTVEPGKSAGSHFHDQKDSPAKKEIYEVMAGSMILELINVETRERSRELLGDQRERETIVFVPPGVAHRIINASKREFLVYLVRSNTECSPAEEIPYDFGPEVR